MADDSDNKAPVRLNKNQVGERGRRVVRRADPPPCFIVLIGVCRCISMKTGEPRQFDELVRQASFVEKSVMVVQRTLDVTKIGFAISHLYVK